MIVSYKMIEEFPGYRVGDDGSVWRWLKGFLGPGRCPPRWKKLRPGLNSSNTMVVYLSRDGKDYGRTVASLVLKAFVGPRPLGFESFFLDGDPANCSLGNLRWAPKGSSKIGGSTTWLGFVGEDHPTCTITDEEVARIRSLHASGEFNRREIAELLDISNSYVSKILKGKKRPGTRPAIRPDCSA